MGGRTAGGIPDGTHGRGSSLLRSASCVGTSDHLISGRVELLRNDSSRLALIEYTSLMHSDLAELSRHVDLLLSSMRLWISRHQVVGLNCAMFVEAEAIRNTACDQEVRTV